MREVFQLFAFVVLAASPAFALDKPVTNAQAAIAVADRLCDSQWGNFQRRNGHSWKVPPDKWHARLVGQRWKVWTDDEKAPGITVYVPHSGRVPSDCDLRFQD